MIEELEDHLGCFG